MKKFQFKSIVALANAKIPVKMAAILLASSTLVSALLGLFRDRLLNSLYLDTYPTGIDAYTAAFTVPDFFFFILTSGALAVSFIPVFNQRLVAGNKKSAWELSSSILNLFALVAFVGSILIMIFADPLIRYVVGPGLDESGTILAINMMRVIAINPFLFSLSTVLCSMQQAVGRFVFYSLAPAVYNIGILIGITWFTGGINLFGVQIFEGGIMGVALGVVFGAVLQVLISIFGLVGLGFDYEFKIYWKNQGFRSVLKLLPARSLDQGIDYINGIVNTNLSSRMGAGSLRSYQQANTLHTVPVSLVGVAISTAFFPKLTEETDPGEDEQFNDTFRTALRSIVWISLPITVISFATRGYLVNFIKNGGDMLIANVLGSLVLAIFAQSVFHIASRGFYAKQDTRTPLIVSIVCIGLATILSVIFSQVFHWGPEGLGWAQSIGAVLEMVVLLAILNRRSKFRLFNKKFWSGAWRMALASVVTSVVAYVMTKLLPLLATDNSFFVTFPKFIVISGVSVLVYVAASYLLELEEVIPFVNWLSKALFRNVAPKPVAKKDAKEETEKSKTDSDDLAKS